MRIARVTPQDHFLLYVVSENGESGVFDVTPYLDSEAFDPLKKGEEFTKIRNGTYFVEWECGADLSADTIEAHWSRRTS
jgi:hypothetical protein